ncbi:MAG: permease-like cell division protein FtsX [Nitrospiraceae bacterium]|nr:permease-like cell division protein FtsX [Nitrospiraceae bacterium]
MRGYGPLFYLIEALRGLRANGLVNLLAVGTISMAMLIVGFFLLVFLNLQSAVHAVGERLAVSVYLKEGVTPQERDFLAGRLKTEPGVRRVTFVPRDEALATLRKELKGQEALLEGLGENPLPDAYELSVDENLSDPARMDALARRVEKYFGVEEVSYGKESVEVLNKLLRLVTYGGMTLAVLLGVSVIFIISNSVRLALYSRRQEIELMQWIGATRGFITGPFLAEGMIVSAGGTAIALAVLAALFHALPREAVLFLSGPGGLSFLPVWVIAYLVGGGAVLGLLGGFFSVNKFLE